MRGRFSRPPWEPLVGELERTPPPPWEAEVQEFRAGGIGVAGVLVLWPDESARTGGDEPAPGAAGGFPPLFVMVLDDRARLVEPSFGTLFDLMLEGDWAADTPLSDVEGRWSVLEGPRPLVKLALAASQPVRLSAQIVLEADEVAEGLQTVSRAEMVALLPAERVSMMPLRGVLQEALDHLVLVPTGPTLDLDRMLRRHGWWPGA